MKTLIVILSIVLASLVHADEPYVVVSTLIKNKQYSTAKTLVNAELKSEGALPKWYYAMGFIKEKEGEKEEAIAFYSKACMTAKKTKQNANSLRRTRKIVGADEALARLMILKPEVERVLFYAGKMEADRDPLVRRAAEKVFEFAFNNTNATTFSKGVYIHDYGKWSTTFHYDGKELWCTVNGRRLVVPHMIDEDGTAMIHHHVNEKGVIQPEYSVYMYRTSNTIKVYRYPTEDWDTSIYKLIYKK